jgi:hypothetical protein
MSNARLGWLATALVHCRRRAAPARELAAGVVPGDPSPGDPHDESACLNAVPRGAPPPQDHSQRLWRASCSEADVRRAYPRCRALACVTEVDRRQITAVRKELDRQYEATVDPCSPPAPSDRGKSAPRSRACL